MLVGLNDKDAAIAAGYTLSMAENTKQKIWKPRVRAEFQRLKEMFELETKKRSIVAGWRSGSHGIQNPETSAGAHALRWYNPARTPHRFCSLPGMDSSSPVS
jgi:hypothetical protein